MLLTTHYLDEAQALADRVAIVKDGAILAEGAAGRAGRRRRAALPRELARRATASCSERDDRRPDGAAARADAPRRSRAASALEDLRVTRPSLEDVYLELTGA